MSNVSTDLLVLRKTPYKETSLIINTLSRDYGRLDFIVQGGKRVSKKSFPVIDLFREIHAEFKMNESGFNKLYSKELVANHDAIVNYPDNYLAACEITKFLSANTQPHLAVPMLYTAAKNSLAQLSVCKQAVPWAAIVKLVYLFEQGLLPELLGGEGSRESEESKRELLDRIICFALGKLDVPEINLNYWRILGEWVDSLCSYHGLRM